MYEPNRPTHLDIALNKLSKLFWHFTNTTVYPLGQFDPPSPAKKLHPLGLNSGRCGIAPEVRCSNPANRRNFTTLMSSNAIYIEHVKETQMWNAPLKTTNDKQLLFEMSLFRKLYKAVLLHTILV